MSSRNGHIIYNGGDDTTTSNRSCECTVSNNIAQRANVTFRPRDIRLTRTSSNSNETVCSSAYLSATFLDTNISCKRGSDFIYVDDNVVGSAHARTLSLEPNASVTLTLEGLGPTDDLPAMVWWEIMSKNL